MSQPLSTIRLHLTSNTTRKWVSSRPLPCFLFSRPGLPSMSLCARKGMPGHDHVSDWKFFKSRFWRSKLSHSQHPFQPSNELLEDPTSPSLQFLNLVSLNALTNNRNDTRADSTDLVCPFSFPLPCDGPNLQLQPAPLILGEEFRARAHFFSIVRP